jgi:hypothetical protein
MGVVQTRKWQQISYPYCLKTKTMIKHDILKQSIKNIEPTSKDVDNFCNEVDILSENSTSLNT